MISTLCVNASHKTQCEDALFWVEDGNIICGGIFDGCSTGYKSHWASQTFAYLYRKYYKYITLDEGTIAVFWDLIRIMQTIGATDMSFVSTCMLFQYNTKTKELQIRVFGDGYYYINDVEYEMEQNNTPDYLCYVMREKEKTKAILEYTEKYPTQIYTDVNSFHICSDGIKRIEMSPFKEPKNKDPYALLFKPPTSDNYLKRMWNILKRDGYTLSDDLSIISYVQDNSTTTE